jgi:hypothetical protein
MLKVSGPAIQLLLFRPSGRQSLPWAVKTRQSLASRPARQSTTHLDEMDGYLLGLKQVDTLSVVVAHLSKVIGILDHPNSPLNTIVLVNKEEALLSHYFYEVRPAVIGKLDSNKKPPTKEEKGQRNTIWISLIFRMLCWLLLHDFDKADVNIVPSYLKGSRMPVFIG